MQWQSWSKNESIIDIIEKELPQSSLYYYLISIVVAIAWVVFLTYYNSRVIGLILTAVLNKFYKYGHLHLGSFSVSVLSGKIMFRDFHIVNEDFSLRIQLGHAIFRWWRPLAFKYIYEDLSHEETRLSVYLDSFELHVYNRSAKYSQLERLFGLDSLILPQREEEVKEESRSESPSLNAARTHDNKWQWRDLVPVIKFEISSGRVVFGNYLVPTTLSITFGEANLVYTTKPPSTKFDEFMHILKCRAEHIKCMFVPSPKYQGGLQDEPPRFMGDGFVILQSSDVDIYYYHDEPGLVGQDQDFIELADGDVIACRTWPCWGMDIKCGKGTDISYGPWADRQREYLYKFFYPADYQPMEVSTPAREGERRVARSFDFKMSMQHDATIDILFSKNKETQAIHMNCRQGSYLEFTVPWLIEETGYITRVNAQLMHVDATTSLQFRSLLECETLEVNIEVEYPRTWNEHQLWKVDLTGCKASVFFIFHHKVFFMDLMEDWSSKARPDLYSFVPYTWNVSFLLKEFELITICNEWNWIHCFGTPSENAHLAFCGDTFDMTFSLPFIDFLPPTVPLKFFIRGESVDARLYLPETNTSRHVIQAISKNMRIVGRDGQPLDHPFVGYGTEKKWRASTLKSAGWVDVWTTPIVAISISYVYHPIPPSGEHDRSADKAPSTTPEAEEMLLTPLRLVPLRPLRPKKMKDNDSSKTSTLEDFDPTSLAPDEISLELEVGPCVLCAYGAILRNFLHIKENYLGEDQKFTDLSETPTSPLDKQSDQVNHSMHDEEKPFDPRHYRPLHVKVQATLHDIQAHLVKNCNEGDPPCPSAFIERVGFEVDKRYEHTMLQVLLSPAILLAKDQWQDRGEVHSHLGDGHLALSGLQVRGHAMFSHKGLPLDAETLEYAWLVEITIGDLTGKLTAPQLQSIIECLQTFVFLVEDSENDLQRANPHYICQHGLLQPECTTPMPNSLPCPSPEDLKYRLTRVSIDCVDLYLTEAGSALNVQVYPVRLSTCNLHGKNNKAGITALIPQVNLKQFVLSIPIHQTYDSRSDVWLEAGGVCFGPVNVDAAMALPGPEFLLMQDKFLKIHDERTHRLWFLWSPDLLLNVNSRQGMGKCGCWGGCTFFGSNRNGPRFFKPGPQDYEDGRNVAALMIVDDGSALGFGQSLLQPTQYMFELTPQPRSEGQSKKRGVLRRQMAQSHDSRQGSVTDVSRSSTLVGYTARTGLTDRTLVNQSASVSSEQTLTGSLDSSGVHAAGLTRVSESTDDRNPRLSLLSSSVPSEYLPEDSIPDVYDSDRMASPSVCSQGQSTPAGSISSLSESNQRSSKGHEMASGVEINSEASQKPTFGSSVDTCDSVAAPSSQHEAQTMMSHSRQSSLTSPILRRISSQQSVQRDKGGSSTSLLSSDRFYSAIEDVVSDSMSGSGVNLNASVLSDSDQNVTVIPKTGRSFHQRPSPLREELPLGSLPHHGSATSTDSTLSFVSAVSSQKLSDDQGQQVGVSDSDENISTEDWDTELENDHFSENFVDLHGQMNQQITKSPLLMSCYMSHMTRLKCSCWSGKPPIPTMQQTQDDDPTSPLDSSDTSQAKMSPETATMHGPAWIPQFAYINEGFTPRLMVSRKEPITPPGVQRSRSPTSTADKPSFFPSSDQDLPNLDETAFSYEDHISQTTAIVKLKGSVDIMFSPLMLEALQRYIEAVTPVLANLHPSAVVDALHFQCSSAVKGQNILKKQESEKETTDNLKDDRPQKKTYASEVGFRGLSETSTKEKASGPEGDTPGQKRMSQLQVMFSLSRINICILQASLVEEVIAFSAIDRVKELTCVSVLAACLDDIQCQILMSNVSQKTLEPITDPSPDTIPNKSAHNLGHEKKHSSLERGEVNLGLSCEAAEMVEHQQEDIVGSLNIARIHFQLRRMKKDSNFSDHISLTAIPEHRSKVLFTFQKQHMFSPSMPESCADQASTSQEETTEDIAGFIMFECGLEDIQLKAAKRSGYNKSSSAADTDTTTEQAPHYKTSARSQRVHTATSHVRPSRSCSDLDSDVNSSPDCPSSHNSADDEASIPSRLSVSSNSGSVGSCSSTDTLKDDRPSNALQGDASSCVLEFKTVWFNFAAPPPSPKKKKLEFTRMDWNLLSTATPGINAWMNPCHRAILAARTLVRCLEERVCTVTACIMMEAVRVQSIHMPIKSRFNKTTLLSRTLQEDPSCQLLTVLRRYIDKVDVKDIEKSLDCDTIPQLLTMKKGILALTREWKNVLYMPNMTQGKGKKKTPQFTVTFAFPPEEIQEDLQDDITLDNFEVVDERTCLLKAEGGSVTGHKSESEHSLPGDTAPAAGRAADVTAEMKGSSDMLAETQKAATAKKRGSQSGALESPSGAKPQQGASLNIPNSSRLKRNESYTSFHSLSTSSQDQLAASGRSSVPGTPLHQSLTHHLQELSGQDDDDLYRWMQKQQETTKMRGLNNYPSMGQDSLAGVGGISEYSHDDSMSIQPQVMPQPAFQQDAQVLFKPLLRAVGLQLEAVKMSAIMKKLGGNMSIKGVLKALRVDIVDSETSHTRKKLKNKVRTKRLPKFHIDTGFETPAFLCDTFVVLVAMKDVVDFEKEAEHETEEAEMRRRSRTLKFALDSLQAKPTTTCVNFRVSSHSVTQHVNMSLLRLIHQFVTMIENVNETRIELKAVTNVESYKGHRKQDSKSSAGTTNTETHSADNVELHRLTSVTSTETETPISDPQFSPFNSPSSPHVHGHSKAMPGTPKLFQRPDRLPLSSAKSPMKNIAKGKLDSPLHSFNFSDSLGIDIADTSSPAIAEKTIVDEIKEHTPKCWRDLYHLLDIYASVPQPKTLCRSRLSVIDEEPEKLSDTPQAESVRMMTGARPVKPRVRPPTGNADPEKGGSKVTARTYTGSTFTQSIFMGERIPLVVYGMMKVKRIRISAMLSGLKLEADLQNVHASSSHRQRIKGVMKRRSRETSATAHVGHTMINLLEGVPPRMQTVVTVNVAQSGALYSSTAKRSRLHNSGLVTVGSVDVDIPQHPVVLHGMVARSSKRLSTTLQEFIRHNPPKASRSHDSVDTGMPTQQPSKHSDLNDFGFFSGTTPTSLSQPPKKPGLPSKPVVIHFKAVLKGLTIRASLLPSLKAMYKMGEVSGNGVTGEKARFNVCLPSHSLSFTSKVQPEQVEVTTPHPYAHLLRRKRLRKTADEAVKTPSNLPSSASIDLPPIYLHADLRQHKTGDEVDCSLSEDLCLLEGNYFNAVAEVGTFEHSLTTDLLNHLVFVQKVFMKEVNEVVQKVSGADQPVPLWGEEASPAQHFTKPLLYSVLFRLQGIQITATTPTNYAVRLETESIELKLSNRVQRASKRRAVFQPSKLKLFVEVQVDLHLALGTLLKNPIFEEADHELQNLAWFKTVISLRNALQDEIMPGMSQDQEALLIACKRPVVCVQPSAFDKAVLIWLNYKNAYEYWNEQRLSLNKEVQTATDQVLEKVTGSLSAQSFDMDSSSKQQTAGTPAQPTGTLFLQLTVEDVGICLPMNVMPQVVHATSKLGEEPRAAMVLTLENTQISACSHGSLVSKGKFKGFCLRFADDFEVSWDDWKPQRPRDEIIMNALVVPDGTYEVCSRTVTAQSVDHNAKWILNITWQMQGIDIHLDTNIGQRLSMLGDTINVLYGEEDDVEEEGLGEEELEQTPLEHRRSSYKTDGLPDFIYDMSLDAKTRARLTEKEMNDQALMVEALKVNGADSSVIEAEERKLQDLETVLFHEFRQDLMKKLKKQSEKATALRDKLGLGYKPASTAPLRPRSLSHMGRLGSARQDSRRLQSFEEVPEKDSSTSQTRTVSLDVASLERKRHGFIELDPDEGDDEMEEIDVQKLSRLTSDSGREGMSHAKAASPSLVGSGGSGQKTVEPNIDFELDIKVAIDRGQCVLHPKEAKSDSDFDKSRGGRVSPRPDRKKSSKKMSLEQVSGRLLHPLPITNTTNFFLPGLNVKLHYTSKVVASEGSQSPASSHLDVDSNLSTTSASATSASAKRISIKKLYAWVSLQQLSEEMLISPALLDFLEQALEPIPLTLLTSDKTSSKAGGSLRGDAPVDLDASASSLISSGPYATSLPIDVVVYIHVKPSLIRFTCLPVSRVECLLRLPSLDVIFSSKKADVESGMMSDMSPANKTKGLGKRVSSSLAPNTSMRAPASSRMRPTSGYTGQQEAPGSSGGLSVTACLADFSLYIFHPYGGGQKKTTLSSLENAFRRTLNASSQSPLGDTGRKDSLSLNVEFVKVNLSRSRRGVVLSDLSSSGGSSAKIYGMDSQRKAANQVKFSAVCDVGSASFKYDMRRLPEILALPKAWYRRALARRMFLGEETAFFDSDEELLSSVSISPPDSPGLPLYDSEGRANTISGLHSLHKARDQTINQHRRVASENKNVPLNVDFRQELMDSSARLSPSSAPQSPSEERHRAFMPRHAHFDLSSSHSSSTQPSGSSRTAAPIREWETMVLFAVKLSELDVAVNMSNVMGNTVWSTKDLKSEGRLSIDSGGYKNMKISAGLGSSKLDARAGIVGGCIEVHQVNTMLSVCEEAGREPEHKVSAGMYSLQTRIDYMGSSILMARLSDLNVILTDYWKVDLSTAEHQPLATRRPTEIYINGDLGWEKFHMMISRSTTPDLLKLASKLEEFFTQQFTSSKRAFSAFGGPGGAVRPARAKHKNSQEDSWMAEIRHHRHWQQVMEKICGCKLSLLGVTLPPTGAYLGGSVTLHGINLTLACFHGINFRSKSWGLFTMEEPYIRFTTDATDLVDDEGAKCMHIIQSLIFQLSHNLTEMRQKRPMAMVCKLSRGHYMPPPFTTVHDWFHYAFATSEIKDLDSFPVVEREGSESPGERRPQRRQQYSHDTEVIFVLPSLQMNLETRHMQGEAEPCEHDPRPVVECSFITQFEDHIFVAMDAEVLLFLHDLVINYVKEKDKGSTPKAQCSPEAEKKNPANPTTVLKQDLRDFNCKTWCLEPTVRLLSWAGKSIDPVGVDYILQKLGFQHARLTIPKWMQRGCMDPLDKILSVLVTQLVLMLSEEDNTGH